MQTNNSENFALVEDRPVSWHKTSMRWFVLLLACLFQLGSYFSTDFPSVLKKQIEQSFPLGQGDIVNVGLLYTVYSTPNVILPLLGGLFIDLIGIRVALVSFYAFLVLGQGISEIIQGLCVIGSVTQSYAWMIAGRLIFGLGGENCVVAQSYIVSKWFFGKELALALGLNITFARIGSVLGAQVLPPLYTAFDSNLTPPMVACFALLVFSWAVSASLALLDKRSDQRDQVEEKIEGDKISFKDMKEFKLEFYLLSLSCVACYCAFFLFQYNNVDMFEEIYGISEAQANNLYSIPYFGAAIFTPIVGFFSDRIGKRTHFLVVCGVLIFAVTFWFWIIPECESEKQCIIGPIIGQSINAVFYSLYAAVMWPCVPLCVPERTVGTAFGVVNAVQNIGMTIMPVIIGEILKNKSYGSYQVMMLILCMFAAIGFASNLALHIVDQRRGGKMSKPSEEAAKVSDVASEQNFSIQDVQKA